MKQLPLQRAQVKLLHRQLRVLPLLLEVPQRQRPRPQVKQAPLQLRVLQLPRAQLEQRPLQLRVLQLPLKRLPLLLKLQRPQLGKLR